MEFTKLKIENYDFGVVKNSIYAFHLNHIFPPLAMAWLHKLSREMTLDKTMEGYSSDLAKFYSFLLFDIETTEITSLVEAKSVLGKVESYILEVDRAILERFAKYCIEVEENKKSTVERAFAALSEFSKFLFTYGFTKYQQITKYMTKGILGKYKTTFGITTLVREQYITPEDFKNVLLDQSWTKNKYAQARNELALQLRYKTGIRTFELIEHDNFDVSKLREMLAENPSGGFNLSIIGKRNKERKVYIDSDMSVMLSNFIKRYLKNYKTGSLFTTLGKTKKPLTSKSFHKEAFNNAIKHYLKNNPTLSQKDRKLWESKDPYALRHSFATNECIRMILNGEPYSILLKELMGHESFETTQNYIQHSYLLISSHPEKYSKEQIDRAQLIVHQGQEEMKKRASKGGNK